MQFTTSKACQILGRDRKTQADDIATGHCGHVPAADGNFRLWSSDDMAGELWFMNLRADHYTVRIAGVLATRLRRAIEAHPEADQLTLATLENGNRFAAPTADLDLSSGYCSGGAVREALLVDVRNLRERVQRMIDAAAQIVGDPDGE